MCLWIRIPIVVYFQGSLQAEGKQAVPETGGGGKSKALCFPHVWKKRLSGNIPGIMKELWVK